MKLENLQNDFLLSLLFFQLSDKGFYKITSNCRLLNLSPFEIKSEKKILSTPNCDLSKKEMNLTDGYCY